MAKQRVCPKCSNTKLSKQNQTKIGPKVRCDGCGWEGYHIELPKREVPDA